MIEADRLAAIADDVGGVRIGGELADGRDRLGHVRGVRCRRRRRVADRDGGAPGSGRSLVAGPTCRRRPRILAAWSGCSRRRPARRWPRSRPRRWRAGCSERPPNRVTEALVAAFGGPVEEAVPVIVLNGNAACRDRRGGGREAAARRVPHGGLAERLGLRPPRDVLIVVELARRRRLGRTCARLARVWGACPSRWVRGIAPVTVVIGKDFTG